MTSSRIVGTILILILALAGLTACEPDRARGRVVSGMDVGVYVDSAHHVICYGRQSGYGDSIACVALDSLNHGAANASR
jgi:hypothetical protein